MIKFSLRFKTFNLWYLESYDRTINMDGRLPSQEHDLHPYVKQGFYNKYVNRVKTNLLLATAFALLLLSPCQGKAQEWLRSRDSHAWARFQPESWKSVRVTRSLVDEVGKVTSEVVTLTTTELIESDRNHYTLGVESTVKIGDQKVNQSKDRIKREINFKGEGFSELVEKATIKIGDYEFPVEVFTVSIATKKGRRVSKVYLSRETMPSVLRRETQFTNKKGEVEYKTTSNIVEYGLTREVLGKQVQVSRVVTSHEQNGVRTRTDEVFCAEIPGGIIAQEITQTNADDVVTARTVMTLLDYGIGSSTAIRGKEEDNSNAQDEE